MRALGRAERSLFALAVPAWLVAGATALLGVYALVLYFHADLTLAQGDAIGHVYVARRVIDSATPSFAQFGYVWLPLPHLLMLPLVWNDTMWHTGLAGSVVSMLAYVGAAVYVHRTVRALTGSGLAGVVTAALFATNPNLLFIQATPMTETLTLFFVVAATYHLIRWAQDESALHLVLSAAFVLAGTLTRYEVWWLVPVGVGIVAVGSQRRYGFGRQIEGLTLTWGMVSSYGIVLWLLYNRVIFGDMLKFLHNTGSAQSFARQQASDGLLPTRGDLIASAQLYGWAMIDELGLPLVLVGIAGFAALLCSRHSLSVKLAALLPASLFAFEIVSLSHAQSAMLSPHSSVPAFVNTRYALLLLPAVVIMASLLARQLRTLGVLILFAALVPQLMTLPTPGGIGALRGHVLAQSIDDNYAQQWRDSNFPLLQKDQPATIVEALVAFELTRTEAKAEGDWLRMHATDGKILISEQHRASALMLYSHLPLSRFIYEGNRPFFEDELRAPGHNTEWIVAQPHVDGDQVDPLLVGGHPPGFDLVFDDGDLQFFRRAGPDLVARPSGVPPMAHLIEGELSLGEADGATEPDGDTHPQQSFSALRCRGGLASLIMTRAVVYAEVPCENLPDVNDLATTDVGLRVQPFGPDSSLVTVDGGARGGVTLAAKHAWIEVAGDDKTAEAADRPAGVPISARTLTGDIAVGDVRDTSIFAHALFAIRCANGLAVVSTTKETLYTDAPCSALPDDHAFLGLPIRLTVHWSDDSAVVSIEAKEAGSVTFAATHVWLASG